MIKVFHLAIKINYIHMKIVLTLTSSLLISLSSFAQDSGCISGDCENGYGTYVWKESGTTYKGNWSNGIRQGKGYVIWSDGTFYGGDWLNGTQTGEGVLINTTNLTYRSGIWNNGSLVTDKLITGNIYGDCQNNYGIYIWSNGDIYLGDYVNGERSGSGTYKWSIGDIYTGGWKGNLMDGYGDYTYSDGTIKSGIWKENVLQDASVDPAYDEGDENDEAIEEFANYLSNVTPPTDEEWAKYTGNAGASSATGCISGDCTSGFGTYVWDSGERYVGNWEDDERNGYGTNYFKDGRIYAGNWKSDARNGYGEQTETDGTKKIGAWENDVFIGSQAKATGCISGDCTNGYGKYVWANGERYEGNWLDGLRNGLGTNYFSDGEIFSGNWKNDKRNGYGEQTETDGTKKGGFWKDDVYIGK
jgi:hypothetical protein